MAAGHHPGSARPASPHLRLSVTLQHAARLAAAALLAAAAGTVLSASPATAETCAADSGVSVVVDATSLGGNIVSSCVPDGGGDTAASLFEVHHDLTRANRFPGAVCRVDGAPADAECQNMPPGDAYWGLFWSDGSGGWVYSSEGVDSLNVPDGGSVAFAWQDGGDLEAPGVGPPQHEEEPSSSPSPSASGNGGDGGSNGGSGGGATGGNGSTSSAPPVTTSTSPPGSATPSEDESDDAEPGQGEPSGEKDEDKPVNDKGKDPDDEDSAQPSDEGSTTPDTVLIADPPSDPADDGLPTWVAPVGIAGLFGVAGAVALLRRRSMS